ncbi:hypothetical protein ACIA5D_51130 [Actinoplanes sp. NPDC051513]|uniref:hypothetical protein n=1 Tax=Actinoplanes sp. NPDC051513 TaxID=3363908 RepID=UPI0037977B5F
MIRTGERWRSRVTNLVDHYQQWEDHRRHRLAGWSVRQRWTVLVLVPTVLVCCGGTVIGVPLAWIARQPSRPVAARGRRTLRRIRI